MPAPDDTDDAPVAADVVVPGTGRPSRSAKRIVAAVVVAAVVLAGLTVWVLAVPYEVELGGETVDCDLVADGTPMRIDDDTTWDDIAEASARSTAPALVRACDDVEERRRNTALLIGAGVAIAACAVSTIPSRRLSGEKLGPLR